MDKPKEKATLKRGFFARIWIDKSDIHSRNDGSNNGISRHNSDVFVESDCGSWTNTRNLPVVKIVDERPTSKPYPKAVPIEKVGKDEVGWMFGGTYISMEGLGQPDDRKCFLNATGNKEFIPLHDRKESQELNDALSR